VQDRELAPLLETILDVNDCGNRGCDLYFQGSQTTYPECSRCPTDGLGWLTLNLATANLTSFSLTFISEAAPNAGDAH